MKLTYFSFSISSYFIKFIKQNIMFWILVNNTLAFYEVLRKLLNHVQEFNDPKITPHICYYNTKNNDDCSSNFSSKTTKIMLLVVFSFNFFNIIYFIQFSIFMLLSHIFEDSSETNTSNGPALLKVTSKQQNTLSPTHLFLCFFLLLFLQLFSHSPHFLFFLFNYICKHLC